MNIGHNLGNLHAKTLKVPKLPQFTLSVNFRYMISYQNYEIRMLISVRIYFDFLYRWYLLVFTVNYVNSLNVWLLCKMLFTFTSRHRIITALHGMQTRSSDENSFRLSDRQTRALWQNGRKICPHFYTMRKIIQPSFLWRRMLGGGRPLLPEILGQPAPVGAKSPILNR